MSAVKCKSSHFHVSLSVCLLENHGFLKIVMFFRSVILGRASPMRGLKSKRCHFIDAVDFTTGATLCCFGKIAKNLGVRKFGEAED